MPQNSQMKRRDAEFYSFQYLIKEAQEFFGRDWFSPDSKFLELSVELIFT